MNTGTFLAEVQAAAGLATPREAEDWARAVLVALVHLAPDSQTRRQFITQLPGGLKARLTAEPPRALLMDREALIQHVGAALGRHAPQAERALGAVWRVLGRAVARGELEDFLAAIPPDAAAWLRRLG